MSGKHRIDSPLDDDSELEDVWNFYYFFFNHFTKNFTKSMRHFTNHGKAWIRRKREGSVTDWVTGCYHELIVK